MFVGFLKYLNHDTEREYPVLFHWKILDFDATKSAKACSVFFMRRDAEGCEIRSKPDSAQDITLGARTLPSLRKSPCNSRAAGLRQNAKAGLSRRPTPYRRYLRF